MPGSAARNSFGTYFGRQSDELVHVQAGGHSVTMGVSGDPRRVSPSADGSTVTFGGVADGADVRYHVTPGGVKEEIVLHEPPEEAEWTFRLDVGGLAAHELGDGSVAFFDPDGGVEPVFTIPRPFMLDNADEPGSADGRAWSDAVGQSVSQDGSAVTLTVTADAEWLSADDREYPVAIDPTIVVEPTPTQGRDAMIREAAPSTNYGQSWQLGVGTDSSGAARSLLWFDVSWLPPGTPIDSAELQMWYDQGYSTNAHDVPIQVLPATAAWDESTVTWNNFAGDTAAATTVVVDDGYVEASDRASAAPYTVHHADGQDTVTVDQTAGSLGEWVRLGRYRFGAGASHEIVLGDVSNSSDAVIADAVRLTDAAGQTKQRFVNSVWHRFEVRDLVADWVDGQRANHGFVLRAADESTPGRGGAYYEAAEYAYNGGPHTNRPKLVITYGEPGVSLDPITTTHATGAELSWSAYEGGDIAEYEIHKSVWQRFTPTSSTLIDTVAPGTTAFADTTAVPTPIDDPSPTGVAFYYQVAVRTDDGELIPGSTRLVRLPKEGQISKVIAGAVDTTLSDAHPDTNFDVFENEPWLSVGDNGGSFGVTRTLVRFPGLADEVPTGAAVYNAE